MKYISTRNNQKTFKFKDVFIKGLADDGGLFIPESLSKYSESEISSFKKLEYNDLAKKIISTYIGDFMSENDLSKIVDKSYSVFRKKNVVNLIKIGDRSVKRIVLIQHVLKIAIQIALKVNILVFKQVNKEYKE